jgi:hypothetical protein
MAEPFSSYESAVVQAVIAMLADSTTFRTLVGADDAEGAKTRIVETWSGVAEGNEANGTATPVEGPDFDLGDGEPWAIVDLVDMSVDQPALGVSVPNWRASINLYIPIPADLLPPEIIRRGRNIVGGIRQDCENQAGDIGKPAWFTTSIEGPTIPEADQTMELMILIQGGI